MVIIGAAMSEQFSINIGLRQWSVLDLLLFIVVKELLHLSELINRTVNRKDTTRKLLYADDLAIVEHNGLTEALDKWRLV